MASAMWNCGGWERIRRIIIAWHAPALSHPDSAALEVLDGVLAGGGRGGTGRLYNALVDNKKALCGANGV